MARSASTQPVWRGGPECARPHPAMLCVEMAAQPPWVPPKRERWSRPMRTHPIPRQSRRSARRPRVGHQKTSWLSRSARIPGAARVRRQAGVAARDAAARHRRRRSCESRLTRCVTGERRMPERAGRGRCALVRWDRRVVGGSRGRAVVDRPSFGLRGRGGWPGLAPGNARQAAPHRPVGGCHGSHLTRAGSG